MFLRCRRCALVRKLAKRRICFVFIIIFVSIYWPLSFIFETSYVKMENTDFLHVGDFDCPESINLGSCTFPAGRENLKSFGVKKCAALKNQCKGFVANEGAKTVTLKMDFYGHGDFSAGISVFIKKTYISLVNYTGMLTTCADSLENEDNSLTEISNKRRCKLPGLDAFDKSIMSAMFMPPKLTCPGQKHLTYYENGKLRINLQSKASKAKWKAIKVKPGQGSLYEFSSSGTLSVDEHEVIINEDMIQVDVTTSNGNTQTDMLLDISPKAEVLKRPKSTGGLQSLNVMIIGLDSTSHSHFQRKLGKVYKYLQEDLKSFIFNGYSIVGDGTTAALIALLTGKKEQDLPEGRYRMAGAKCLDDWPWIFQEFKRHGYATMYSEDEVDLGAFTYRLMGFCNPPIDHYMLPYWFAAIDALSNSPWYKFGSKSLRGHCVGSQAIHNVSLDIVKSMFKAYPQTPKFGLTFLSDICHNQLNGLSMIEDDLYEFLKSMKKHLENTMLVILGDHGIRFGSIRSTAIGKMEERLPFLSISLPKWFEKTYPKYVENLRGNLNVLTSPLDVHATFAHILSHPELPPPDIGFAFGKSLFTNISDRTCLETGIPTHFCPCMEWKMVDVNHEHVKKSAAEIVRHINGLVTREALGSKCSLLTLKEIRSAVKVTPNEDVATYEKAADVDGREVLKGEKPKGICSYQLQILTSPNEGIFEATVQVSSLKTFVNPQMSRIDRYGDQPNCIKKTHPHMREYCYCAG